MGDVAALPLFDEPSSSAVLSDDGRYRYRLGRRWAPGPTLGWIMLNPSTADATADDPTIRRCIAFARREGCGAIDVANLYAWRATDPDSLLALAWGEAVGPDNHHHVADVLAGAERTVAAWGAWWNAQPDRRRPARLNVESVAALLGAALVCLGRTKAGAPRHPLYVRGDQPLEPFAAIDQEATVEPEEEPIEHDCEVSLMRWWSQVKEARP